MGIQERREREKEERRNQIIKTARKEFIKSGIRNASIKDIARKAELSPRTIYTYFNNKQELYVAILLSGLKILCNEIAKIASEEEDPVKAIKMVKEAYGSFYRDHRDYFRIMIFIGFHDIHEDVGKEPCQEISDAVLSCITLVSGIIEKGINKGLFNGGNPWKLSWVLWSLFVGIGHLNEARQSLDAGKNDFDRLFDFAFKGLLIA
jgi:AcrR family transcriptional regulator